MNGSMNAAASLRQRRATPAPATAGTGDESVSEAAPPPAVSEAASPTSRLWPFLLPLLAVRVCAALTVPISDCDETFNYWEPLHFLLHGRGLQTWEYSPAYALRSYAYLALHAVVAKLAALATSNKLLVFYSVRAALGAVSALCEAQFVRRVGSWASQEVALYTWLLLLSSAGMFHSAVSFLPSSFTMWVGVRVRARVGVRVRVPRRSRLPPVVLHNVG